MEKSRVFDETWFAPEVIEEALKALPPHELIGPPSLTVDLGDATWVHDSLDEFFADYRRCKSAHMFRISKQFGTPAAIKIDLSFDLRWRSSRISVQAPSRPEIERVFAVFENALSKSRLRPLPRPPAPPPPPKPRVFIGHGKSPLWREIKDHLHDKQGYGVECYEVGARAGHAIRDILLEMMANSSFAILVLAAEDEMATGSMRPRQNVVHEAGLFQGHLGFQRAIAVVEEGTELFSNIEGIEQIRFGKGNIKEAFGEILATLHREVPRR